MFNQLQQRASVLPELGERLGETAHLRREIRELHVRRVLRAQAHYWPECSCGWLGTGCISEIQAETEPCPVEEVWAESALRRSRLYQAQAGRGR